MTSNGTIEIEFEGQIFSAGYTVKGKKGRETITVQSAYDTTTAPLGSTPPEQLAKLIFREHLRWAQRNGTRF
jgi:hypothetical protein